jgi:cytochrome P450
VDVDVDQAMTDLTLEIICRTMFQADVADQSAQIREAVAQLSVIAFHEMQAPLRLPAWIPISWNVRKRRAIEVLDRVIWKFIQDHGRPGQPRGGLLSMLLDAQDPEMGGSRLSDRQVRDEAMTLMLAGHDTTAAAFDWLWHCLAKHPTVAQKCFSEISAAVGDREPMFDDIALLPYLVATIKETLRLYPPAFAVFLRQTTTDLEIGGYLVPKGSLITTSSFVIQRDPRWFPEPERFDPERFLGQKAESIPPQAYFPFGAGPRACIGQSFAMTELTLVAATLLQRTKVSVIEGHAEPQMHVTMALRPKERLTLRWSLRT